MYGKRGVFVQTVMQCVHKYYVTFGKKYNAYDLGSPSNNFIAQEHNNYVQPQHQYSLGSSIVLPKSLYPQAAHWASQIICNAIISVIIIVISSIYNTDRVLQVP